MRSDYIFTLGVLIAVGSLAGTAWGLAQHTWQAVALGLPGVLVGGFLALGGLVVANHRSRRRPN